MKIESLISKLDEISVKATNVNDWLDKDIVVNEIIDTLLEYIGNEKIRAKVDEIPF